MQARSRAATRGRRAACDRCHALKNRCVLPDDSHGTCERCQRLNLACQFSEKMQTGRPRRQQGRPQPLLTEEDTIFDMGNPDSTSSSATYEGQTFMGLDTDELVDWGVFCTDTTSTNTSGDSRIHGGPSSFLPPPDSESIMTYDDTVKSLLELQTRLHSLTPLRGPEIHDEATGTASIDEAKLCEILKATEGLNATLRSQQSTESAPVGQLTYDNHEQAEHAEQAFAQDECPMSPIEGASDFEITLLHGLTCYLHILRLLKPFVTRLGQQSLNSEHEGRGFPFAGPRQVAVSYGSFSLASKPAMNARLTLGIIRSLLEEIHQTTCCVLSANTKQSRPEMDATQKSSPPGMTVDGAGEQNSSSMVDAAQLALRAIRRDEVWILRRLQNSIPI